MGNGKDNEDGWTAVGGKYNGSNSDGGVHGQQSTKCGSKDTVAVAKAMETATATETAMVTVMTKMPTPTMVHR